MLPALLAPPARTAGGLRCRDRDGRPLVADPGPPVRVTEEIAPAGITRDGRGRQIVDFGQNLTGWVRLQADGAAGTVIRVRHAEVLDGDGGLYTQNLRTARQTDEFVLGGGPAQLEPRFTLHGFRYAEVTGYPGDLEAADVAARVAHSDIGLTGSLGCSEAWLDRLFGNIDWGQRGNFISVPTDCPQRDERLGWLGDAQVFARTACYNPGDSAFQPRTQSLTVSTTGTLSSGLMGGFRFEAITLSTPGTVVLRGAGVQFGDGYLAKASDYQGYFLSSSNAFNTMFYDGAYTDQTDMQPAGTNYLAGDTADAERLIHLTWDQMTDRDNPFFTGTMWENIGPDGTATQSRTSLAHGWASGPTPIMTGYVLGVQPVDPGYQTFTVAPHFGSLLWAEGAAPTPYGRILVRWANAGLLFSVTVTVPPRSTALIQLPNGRHVTLPGGPRGTTRTFVG